MCSVSVYAGRLQTSGTHFVKDGQRVFLSGANLAWVSFGYDFGNNQYQRHSSTFSRYLTELQASGGNSLSRHYLCFSSTFLR